MDHPDGLAIIASVLIKAGRKGQTQRDVGNVTLEGGIGVAEAETLSQGIPAASGNWESRRQNLPWIPRRMKLCSHLDAHLVTLILASGLQNREG